MIKKIFHSYLFWIVFTAVSIASAIFTYKLFPRAFPILRVNITMDRSDALEQAQTIAKNYSLGPLNNNQAIQFTTDQEVKTFIELDAGGIPAFTRMIDNNLYQPYLWQVRHFKEFDAHELIMRFTPDGKKYGFLETIGENVPGARLATAQAQKIAERDAIAHWHVDLTAYSLIEHSQEVRQSERIDHTFVYERTDAFIGKGFYRVRLTVSGDKLTEVTYSVKVPEEFLLRYKEMRSANESIASAATMLMIILYIMGGCIVGLIILARNRFILWKMPLFWGLFVAFLNLLAGINELPLLWMHYDTALPARAFLLSYMLQLFLQFCAHAGSMTLFFMAAESLSRKAFGNHLQLWKTWSPRVASSFSVVGQTIAGYLLVSIDFIFLVLFYLCTRTMFGWWVPADEIANPNILATYFPWVSSIAQSLMAGFQEECLFRAIPLAGAALIGARFGKRNLFIAIAFIMQAIIFGAAHANYAAQPSYARLIELIIPSWIFGALYLAFGLLPGIIMHFIIDVVWFALPIFAATTPFACINQGLVIVASLIPIFVLIYARWRYAQWHEAQEQDYNKQWQPNDYAPREAHQGEVAQKVIPITQRTVIFTLIAGMSALGIWFFATPLKQDGLPLEITRAQAQAKAQEIVSQEQKTPGQWQTLQSLMGTFELNPEELVQHRFIWQHDKQLYRKLIGSYLMPAHWLVRSVTFNGSLHDRAEEFQTRIGATGITYAHHHKIAESAPAPSLSENNARSLAYATIEKKYGIPKAELQEISATPLKHPNRVDWQFVTTHTLDALPVGQTRITIGIIGDTIASVVRSIHVPDEWKRQERNHQNWVKIITLINNFCLYILLTLSLFLMLKTAQKVSSSRVIKISAGLAVLFLINIVNVYPEIIAQFNTAEPWNHQLFTAFGMAIIAALVKAACLGVIIAAISSHTPAWITQPTQRAFLLGITSGIIVSALVALVYMFEPSRQPLWADYSALTARVPLFAYASVSLGKFFMLTTVLSLMSFLALHLATMWHHRYLPVLFSLLAGIILVGTGSIESILFWLLAGSAIGFAWYLIYVLLLKKDYSLIPLAAASYCIMELLQQASFNAFPNTRIASVLAAIVIIFAATLWFRNSRRQ